MSILASAVSAYDIGSRNNAQTATFQNNNSQLADAASAASSGNASNADYARFGSADKQFESRDQFNGMYAKIADDEQDTQDKLQDKRIKQTFSTLG